MRNNPNPRNRLNPLTLFIGTVLHHDPLLNRPNCRLQRLELRRQYDQACPGIVRQLRIGFVCDDRKQLFDPFASLQRYNAELG